MIEEQLFLTKIGQCLFRVPPLIKEITGDEERLKQMTKRSRFYLFLRKELFHCIKQIMCMQSRAIEHTFLLIFCSANTGNNNFEIYTKYKEIMTENSQTLY